MSWKFWKKSEKSNFVDEAKSLQTSFGSEIILPLDSCNRIENANACQCCGACCAFYLVSFPAHETDNIAGGLVPVAMSGLSKETLRFMNGTETKTPRCNALRGFVGTRVTCAIYENRPSTCRKFIRSWENGVGNFLCDKARMSFGLQEFSQY